MTVGELKKALKSVANDTHVAIQVGTDDIWLATQAEVAKCKGRDQFSIHRVPDGVKDDQAADLLLIGMM